MLISILSGSSGFGGNDRVVGNLMVNFNRQTRAHGVINQWERAPYISDIGLVRNYSKVCRKRDLLHEILNVMKSMKNDRLPRQARDKTSGKETENGVFFKAAFNTTDDMPTLEQLEAGYFPAYSPAPPGNKTHRFAPFQTKECQFIKTGSGSGQTYGKLKKEMRFRTGVGSVVSPFRRVHNNVLIANYQSLSAVTLDDGGSRMLQYNNYIICARLAIYPLIKIHHHYSLLALAFVSSHTHASADFASRLNINYII